jgi:tetratricopeptide (TPR) repeat protein
MNSVLALQSLAIQAARESKWDEAVHLNQEIVDQDERDISALNRLGFCYLQTRALKKAKDAYTRVLLIDKYNAIAKKYLEMIALMELQSKGAHGDGEQLSPLPNGGMFRENFIDEPGKTKTVQLCRVADPSALSRIAIGTPCELVVKMHRIAVETGDHAYLGSLPDDLSHHLTRLINGGNKYKVVVKSVSKNCVTVFLKELSRCKRFAYTMSFPNVAHQMHGEAHEELLIDQPSMDLSETGDDAEEPEETMTIEEV